MTQSNSQLNDTVGENNSALGYGDATNGDDHYWGDNYKNAPYYNQDYDYERDYRAAYAAGYSNRAKYDSNAKFEEVESELEQSWQQSKGDSRLEWSEARHAVSDAWHRASQTNR